tara:strand:- start:2199 stop:3356 length:1158 start_codon:yes stop_codon:yes gene_type:complete
MSVLKMSAVSPSQSSSVLQFVKSIAVATRQVQCPVRTKYWGQISLVTEYLIPIALITTDQHSQSRRRGKNGSIVSSLSKQLRLDGQNLGICCFAHRDDLKSPWELRIRWGSHRWNAAKMIDQMGETILHAKQGHIWMSLYNEYHTPDELNKLQTIENNLIEAKEPAKEEDNIDSLNAAWKDGDLDVAGVRFSKLPQKDKEASLKAWIKVYCGANVKRPGDLVKKFFAFNNGKVKTDTKTSLDHQNHWNLYEQANFGVKFEKAGKRNNIKKDAANKTHVQYHMTAAFDQGALVQQMIGSKFSLDPSRPATVDVVHLVASLPLSSLKDSTTRTKARKRIYDCVKHINNLFKHHNKKVVDWLYVMPQTQQEEANARNLSSPWVARIKM